MDMKAKFCMFTATLHTVSGQGHKCS
jgi:hypothetical protein